MTAIDQVLRHGGTFKTALCETWPLTGFWDELDALAAEHRRAVDEYEAVVDAAPKRPSVTDYDRACREAIRNNEPLPEPPTSPTAEEVQAGEIRVTAARDRVHETTQRILDACRTHADEWKEAPSIREPVAHLTDRIATMRREIEAAEAELSRYERVAMWLEHNQRMPWTDPNGTPMP